MWLYFSNIFVFYLEYASKRVKVILEFFEYQCGTCKKISNASHLFLADDSICFILASEGNSLVLKWCLDFYFACLGQIVNADKSELREMVQFIKEDVSCLPYSYCLCLVHGIKEPDWTVIRLELLSCCLVLTGYMIFKFRSHFLSCFSPDYESFSPSWDYKPWTLTLFAASFFAFASNGFVNQLYYFCSWKSEIRSIISIVYEIFIFRISPITACKVTLSFSSTINGASSSQRNVKILYKFGKPHFVLSFFCLFLQNCVSISGCKKVESKIWLESEKKNKKMSYFLFSFFLLCIFFFHFLF